MVDKQCEKLDLSNFKIFDIYGIKNIKLEGEYSAETLSNKLIEEWVPYIDCERKCSRSDYCKFTQLSPYRPDRLTDVRCGVVVSAMRNFVEATFHILANLPDKMVENYLDGVFYFSQFIFSAELMIGSFMDEGVVDWYKQDAPAFFGYVTRLRDELNNFASVFRKIPELRSAKGVLFLEGWTEKAFLEKLRESHSAWFSNLILEVYSGSGNRRPKRIQMLLDNYVNKGYKIYIQGDADGRDSKIFDELVRKGSIHQGNTFVFKYDFESSVPPILLLNALKALGELSEVEPEEFLEKIHSFDKSVVFLLQKHFQLDINPIKLELASTIAEYLNKPFWSWWKDEDFMKTELGQFLHFIRKII